MEPEIIEILKEHIRQTENTRDFFVSYPNNVLGEREALYADKILKDSLRCFVAILEEKDIHNKIDLLGSLLLDSIKISSERAEGLA